MFKKLIVWLSIILLSAPAYAMHSLEFDGIDDYVYVAHDDAFHTVPFKFSKEFRLDVLPSTRGEDMVIAEKQLTSGYSWKVHIDQADDKIHFSTNSGAHVIISDNAVNVNTRTVFMVTISSSLLMRMWVIDLNDPVSQTADDADYLQADTETTAALDVTNPQQLRFWGTDAGTDNFDGTVYDGVFWNSDTAAIDVSDHFLVIEQFFNVEARWPYFDGEGNQLWTKDADLDNSKAGTIVGATWNVDSVNFLIEEEYNDRYWPGNLTGSMNIGVDREVELYAANDFSWTRMPQSEWDKCVNIYHIWDDAVGAGDGSTKADAFTSPSAAIQVPRNRYGNCFELHEGTYNGFSIVTDGNYNANCEPSQDCQIWVSASGDGKTIIEGHNTDAMTWTVTGTNANVFEADFEDAYSQNPGGTIPLANIILDDNFPWCCEREASFDQLDQDGDWYYNPDTFKVYLHTSGDAPTTRDVIAIYGNENNFIDTIAIAAKYPNVYIHGLEVVGSAGYAFKNYDDNIQGTNNTGVDYLTLRRNTTKYSSRGFTQSLGPSFQKFVQNRSHGDCAINVGNGVYATSYQGNSGGWPNMFHGKSYTILDGNILTWSGGEGLDRFAGNGTSRDNIIMNAWSILLYSDSAANIITERNIVFNHTFMPHWIPDEALASGRPVNKPENDWRRMFPEGILFADEFANDSEGLVFNSNVVVNAGYCNNTFAEALNGNDPSFSGWKDSEWVHNVCITPAWDQSGIGRQTKAIRLLGSGQDVERNTRFMNNIFIFPHRKAQTLFFNGPTGGNDAGVDSDYNYYVTQNPYAFFYRGQDRNFADYKTASGYEENSILGSINGDGYMADDDIIARRDWNMEGDFVFKLSDFALPSNSRLINSGTLLPETNVTGNYNSEFDIDKKKRPLNGGRDIGLFERGTYYPKEIKTGVFSGGSL